MKVVNQEAVKTLTEKFMQELKANSISSKEDSSLFARALFDSINQEILNAFNANEPEQITSPNAVIEVINQADGQMYRRYLELEFDETDNGLRLSGENMTGESTEIVFLSEEAIRKIADLRGFGANEPRCNDHD